MDNSTPMTAREYDKKIEKTIPFYSEFYKQSVDLIKSLPFKEGKWLDTGCGTGEFILKAIEECNNFQFVLCDPSTAMISEARCKLNNKKQILNFCVCGSQHLNFSEEFNIITAIQSHHYMQYEDRLVALQNCFNALRENGALILFENYAPGCEYSKNNVMDRWGRYQRENGKSDIEVEEHLKRYGENYFPITLSDHAKVLKSSGFKIVEIFWLSYMQVGIYAIK